MNTKTAVAAAAVLMLGAAGIASDANAAQVLLQCVDSNGPARIAAFYQEEGSGRKTTKSLDIDVEIDPNRGYKATQMVTFHLDGKKIGQQRLVVDSRGDLDADLKPASSRIPQIKSKQVVSARVRGEEIVNCRLP